jgi:hypothetical protein
MKETQQLLKANQEVVGIFQEKTEAMALPEDHVHSEAGKAFMSSITQHGIKPQLLLRVRNQLMRPSGRPFSWRLRR